MDFELLRDSLLDLVEMTHDVEEAMTDPLGLPMIDGIFTKKPSWDDAPEWANYLVCNASGRWLWFEKKPVFTGHSWLHADWSDRGLTEVAKRMPRYHDAEFSLESR